MGVFLLMIYDLCHMVSCCWLSVAACMCLFLVVVCCISAITSMAAAAYQCNGGASVAVRPQ